LNLVKMTELKITDADIGTYPSPTHVDQMLTFQGTNFEARQRS
jgi:hypothetical protein